MFNNQSEWRDENIEIPYKPLFKQWCEDNGVRIKRGHYINADFLQYVIMNYKEEGKYTQEMWSLLDLLIRKNMTSKHYIGYDDDIKSEMYGNAIDKIALYTIDGFNPERGKAFVFFTSAIQHAFKEVLKNYYKSKNLAVKLLKEQGQNVVAYNTDSIHSHYFEEEIKKALEFVEYAEDEIKEEIVEMYEEIKELYPNIRPIKIIEDDNAPKFKRKWYNYNYSIPVEGTEKYIIIEYFSLRLTNENVGTTPDYIKNRALIARRKGHQYFGVFSDMWDIGKELLLSKLEDMITNIQLDSKVSTGKNLMIDYIHQDDLIESNLNKPVFWGLHKDLTQRKMIYPQDVETYINWLDNEENATRVYDAGSIKNIKGDK